MKRVPILLFAVFLCARAAFAAVVIDDVTADDSISVTTIHRISVTVRNQSAVAGGFTIPWSTHDGTALAGQDYRTASGTLTFAGAAGETQQAAIAILGDGLTDGGETFTVVLGTPSNPAAIVDKSTATVTVNDGTFPGSTVFEVNAAWNIGGAGHITRTFTSWMAQHPEALDGIIFLWDIPTDFGGCAVGVAFDPNTTACAPFPAFFPTAGEDATGAFVFDSAVWQTRTRLELLGHVVDRNETLRDVDLQLREGVGRRDRHQYVNANQVLADFMTIDTLKPVVSSVTPNLGVVRGSDTGSAALTLTIVFSKAMQQAIAPVIAFTGATVTPTLTPAGGSWLDDHTYVARFDVTDAHQYATSVGVNVSGATDDHPIVNGVAIGNVLTESTTSAVFAINMTSAPIATLSIAPASVATNAPATMTLSLGNPNPVALTGAAFALALPAGVAIATPNGLSSTCGAVGAAAGASSIVLSDGTLPPSSDCTIAVNLTSAIPGPFTIDLPAGALTTANSDPTATAAQAEVAFVAPLSVSATFAPATISLGGSTTLTVTLFNANAFAATGVSLDATLPAGVVINTATVPGGNGCGGTLTAVGGAGSFSSSGGTVPANSTCTIAVSLLGTSPGTHSMSFPAGSITSAETPPNAAAIDAAQLVVQAAQIPTLDPRALVLLALALAIAALLRN